MTDTAPGLTREQLIERLKIVTGFPVKDRRDNTNSISSKVIRCRYKGQRAVAVEPDAKADIQIKALLDLLDLHLNGDGNPSDDLDDGAVTLILGSDAKIPVIQRRSGG